MRFIKFFIFKIELRVSFTILTNFRLCGYLRIIAIASTNTNIFVRVYFSVTLNLSVSVIILIIVSGHILCKFEREHNCTRTVNAFLGMTIVMGYIETY